MLTPEQIEACTDSGQLRSLLICCDNDCEHLTQEQHGYTWACERFGAVLDRTVDGYEAHEYEAFRCLACLKAELTEAYKPAPMVEEVEELLFTFKSDLRRATPGDVSEMMLTLCNVDDLHKAIRVIAALSSEVNRLRRPRPLPSIPANLRQSIELIPTLCAPLDMPTRLELAINDICMAITPLLEHIASKDAEREILMGRIATSDDARDTAVREMSAYARRCGELESQLCAQLVEHPGRKALLLVLAELRRAKLKHPVFAASLEQALVALASEQGELATAILKDDIDGEHGVSTEAGQVAAVAIRIIELVMSTPEASA